MKQIAYQTASGQAEPGSDEDDYHSKRLRVNELYFDQLQAGTRPLRCSVDEHFGEIVAMWDRLNEAQDVWDF